MTMLTDEHIAAAAAQNPEPQGPNIYIIDDSGSTAGAPLDAINAALPVLRDAYRNNDLAAKRAKIALVSLSRVELVRDFCSPNEFEPPVFTPFALTPLGAAMELAYETLIGYTERVRALGIKTFRPNIFTLGDGGATDDITRIAATIRKADKARLINSFVIGFSDVDLKLLEPFTYTHAPVHLDGLAFDQFFDWSTQLSIAVSRSRTATGGSAPPTGEIDIPSPKGWMKA